MRRRHSHLIGDSAVSNDEVWRAERRTKLANCTAPFLFERGITVEAARELSTWARLSAICAAWPEHTGAFYDDELWRSVLSALEIYWRPAGGDPFEGLS